MKEIDKTHLYKNKIYRDDMRRVLRQASTRFLKNKSILITGATGLICSAVVDMLLEANRIWGNNTTIYIASRSQTKVKAKFPQSPNLVYVHYDALEPIRFHICPDYVIHGAGIASPDLYIERPVETMLMNFTALNGILEYAYCRNVKRVLFISSSEVYGKNEPNAPHNESEYGKIDFFVKRASYPESKRAAETLCKAYFEEYSVNVVIGRPGHIYGPTAQRKDKRIVSEFAFKSADGLDLPLNSPGFQKRSYMYCLDCAAAMLCLLERGISGEAYNVCSREVITIKEMAEYLAEAGNVKLKRTKPSEGERQASNPMDNSALDFRKLYSLGFSAAFLAREGLAHTVEILKQL